MSKNVKENHVDDFQDLFEDDFLDTEESATAAKKAQDALDGKVAPDEGSSASKSNKSNSKFGFLDSLNKKDFINKNILIHQNILMYNFNRKFQSDENWN